MISPDPHPSWLGRCYLELKKFLRSALFYIALGCVFLTAGFYLTGYTQTHSAFVFIIVILGVALVLYGTGTNASGSGSSGTINIFVAGGAGVLALLLGFGVVDWRKELVEVFKHQRDYGLLDLSVSPESGALVDLSSFDVQAKLGGRVPLPLWYDNQRIEIVVPIPDDLDGRTTVAIKLTPKPGSKSIYVGDIDDIPIDWEAKDKVGETSGYANEKIKVYRQAIAPKKPAQLNVGASDELGSALANFTIAPQ